MSPYEEARARLVGWYRAGALRSKFDIAEGLESTPRACLRLLTSQNLGKQLVRVAKEYDLSKNSYTMAL